MSWYRIASHVEAEAVEETFAALGPEPGSLSHAPEETGAQFRAAVAAAAALVASGALGAGPFTVNVSGHANPGHEDMPGWATDCISVNVTREAKPQG